MTRATAARWGAAEPLPAEIDVLIPTAGRTVELAVTLAGLAAQDGPAFRVVVSDQSDAQAATTTPGVRAMIRVLEAQGREVAVLDHRPRRGMAEQRQFLLDHATADAVLYLDDDVWLELGTIATMHRALRELGCGLVGCAPQGLSYLRDDRPHERTMFEPWQGRVEPEHVSRTETSFGRFALHNAANLVHVARELGVPDGEYVPYRIAWVGGCVLFDRHALLASGGFQFWRSAPALHSGEDVAAEWRVMERFGGAGILPSGAVHLEAPTTIPDRPVDLFDLDRITQHPDTERRAIMADTPNPIQIQKFLGGIDYPADKDLILQTARDSGADQPVLDALNDIPDKEYDGPTAVSEAVAG